MKSPNYLLILCMSSFMLVTSCGKEENERFKNDNFCAQMDEIDLKMLNTIKEIEGKYKEDKKFLKAFADAQVYWVQYRNRHVKALFPLSPREYDYNVGDCKCKVIHDLTQERVKQLEIWINGFEPSEVCRGSVI